MRATGAATKVEAQAHAAMTDEALRPFREEAFGSRPVRGGCLTKWKGEAASYAPHLAQLMAMVARPRNASLAALALASALAARPAAAADYWWDADGSGLQLGGTGTWNTSAPPLWNSSGNPAVGPFFTWNNAAPGGDNAIFAGTAGTVTLGSPITAHNLTFNIDGYTLTGGTLTLTGTTPTIFVAAGTPTAPITATIGSAIAGSAGLTKMGAGVLTLNGANTFSGGVNVNAGTLTLNGASSFTGDVNVASGATLGVANDAALGAAANRILTTAGATLTLGGVLSDSRVVLGGGGQTTVSGAGAAATRYTGAGGLLAYRTSLTNNANDYTGKTTVQIAPNDVINFTSVGNLGQASALGAASDPTLGTISVQRVNGSTGYFAYTGAGADTNRNWDLSAALGHLVFSNNGGGTLTLRGNITTTGTTGTAVIFSANSADMAFLGSIGQTGSLAGVSFAGSSNARTITLGDANSFIAPVAIGTVTVKAGTLADGGANSSLGIGTSVALTNGGVLSYTGGAASSNRTWTFDGATTLSNDGTGALTFSGAASFVAGGTDTLTLGGGYGGTNTFSGVISGTGNLGSSGAGTWVLTGANTRTGTIRVDGGTLRAGSASAFGTTTAITVNGGTLDLNNFNLAATSLAGTGGTVALGSGNLTVNPASGTMTFAGSITGTGGSLTKLGAGTLTLTGANSYTGATSIGGGTLALDFTAAGAPASNIISNASTLNMAGGTLRVTGAGQTQSFAATNITAGGNTIAGSGTVTINLGAINRSDGLVNFVLPTTGNITTTPSTVLGGWATVSTGNITDYAQVDASGNIIARTTYANKDDAGTWATGDVVSDTGGTANTPYFGTVAGNVQLGGLKYTAAAPSTVTIGSRLGVDGTIIVSSSVGANALTITGGQLTGPAGGATLGVLQSSTGNFTIASTIVDNGGATGFTKAGTGLVTLSGANTYTGATTVSGGTLSVNSIANGSLPSAIGASSADPSNLVLQGGTLQYTGGTTTSDRGFTITTNGAVTSDTINVSQAGTNLTFSGVVTSPDNAGLTKTGPGTLTLSNAANTYTGITTVNQGTLAVSTLANGGLPSSIGASSSASSNLVLQGGGELEYIGGTASSNRGFTLAGVGGAIDVAQNTTLTMSGVATGAGSLAKNGAGTLVLSGTNTYTGATTVSAGTLRAGSISAFGTGPVTVNTGAALDLAGFNNMVGGLNGPGNVLLGAATLTVNGNGSFSGAISGNGGVTIGVFGQGINPTFSGCGNSYAGATTINSGNSLTVDCLANGGSPSGIGASAKDSTNLVLINGALNYTGGTVTTDRGFSMPGAVGGSIGVQNAATTLTFTGQVTGVGGIVTKYGAGTLVLSGNNTYSGGTGVSAGILRAGSTSAFGTGGMGVSVGATLDLANLSNTVASLSGGGTVTLGSATLTLSDGADQNFSGAISGTGGLVKNGTGTQTQTLSGLSSYTGSTVVNGGILAVTKLANGLSNSSIGASSNAAGNLILNGGTLQYVGTGDTTDRLFTLGSSAASKLDASGTGADGAIHFGNSGAIAFSSPNTAQTIRLGGVNTRDNSLAALITDNGTGLTSLTKEDAGTWILRNSASTYTGVTTISGGVLAVDKLADGGQASSIGQSSNAASNLVIGSGSTLRYTGSGDTTDRLFTLQTGVSVIQSSGTGAIVFSNTGSAAYTGSGTRTLALGGTNTGLNTMGGTIIDGPGGVTQLAKNDSGTWVLTGNNSYSGNTVINDGNLIIGNGGTTGNAGTGNVIVNSPTSTLSFNRSDTFNFAGTLSGPGSIAQIGTGTTILTSATNAIGGARIDAGTLQVNGGLTTGSATINAGVLAVSAGGTLTTPTLAMNAGSTLTVGGTAGAAGGAQTVISGDAGASTINVNAGGTLRANGDLGDGSDTVNLSGTLDTGAAALGLGAGTDTLVLNDTATFTGAVDAGAGTDTLQVVANAARTLAGATVTNFESLLKQGTGTLTLTGAHSYSAGTTISQGTLQVGDGTNPATLASNVDVASGGTLTFNLPSSYSFGGTITGGGAVQQIGAGTTILTADSSAFAGTTSVSGGALLVNGTLGNATSTVGVLSGATLGGTGTIGGSVTVADGGTLTPGTVGTVGHLAINGGLTLNASSNLNVDLGQPNVPGGPLNDLLTVGGNLTLAGTLNVAQTSGGIFGPGIYRLINYSGTLTNNGLAVGTTPAGSTVSVQTSVAGQVNLTNTAGQTLNFWDGDAGPKNNGVVNGGDGTWRASGDDNWTGETGQANGAFAPNGFAIFQGAPGTVAVDAAGVSASGMQFAADGYTVQDGTITLVGPQSTIRVGAGAVGADYVATIASTLTGNTQLLKDDLGTLVLSGANSYTGGTLIKNGTLQVSSDENLGDAAGALTFGGGTLHTTASLTSDRDVMLDGAGTIVTDGGTTATFAGATAGAGRLTKDGAGTLVVAGDATHAGGTTIAAGTLQIGDGTTTGTLAGDVTNNGTLAFNRSDLLSFTGVISGTGAVLQSGGGITVLTGDNTYAGGTTIAAGTLQLGDGGTSGSITGNVANDGTLAFNRSDVVTFAGVISGSGDVQQVGTGTTILTADNSYSGGTTIAAGTLQLGAGGTSGSITGDIANDGTLIFNRSNPVTFAGAISGSGDVQQVGSGTTTLTGTNSYAGGTTITAGTLRISADVNLGDAAGGLSFNGGTLNTTADISSSRAVTLAGAGTVLTDTATTATFAGPIAGAGALTKDGAGTMVIAGDASHSGGTTIADGALQIGTGSTTGTLAGDVTNNGTLAFNRSDSLTFAGLVSGSGAVQQIGTGTTILTADSGYTGGTTIAAGTLQLGDGGTSGWITGNVTNNGTLAFNRSDAVTFAGLVSGTGGLDQRGTGTTTLTANNSYTGPTNVSAGTLIVSGDQSAATGLTTVTSGGTLGGTGTLGGGVTVTDGAINPGNAEGVPGTLTVKGGLALAGASTLNYDFGQAEVEGGPLNDLIRVGGNLTLAGTINVTESAGGTFGPGVYRVIAYDGALTNNGLALGTMPNGSAVAVQTSVAHQVNLVNSAGLTLNFWDGELGPKNDNAVNGGNGTWTATGGDNWTGEDGAINGAYADGGFAVFQGAPGTVTVDAAGVAASGMQFTVGGYTVQDGPISLVADAADPTNPASIIRVGDGTADGATYVATIASALTGTQQLVKTDLGTLVLTGANTYTGGTAINGGTVQISSDVNLGDAAGGLTFNGGTLHTTADLISGRDVTLAGAGRFLTDAGTTTTLTQAVTGAGALTKDGAGTLVLAADNSYQGGTTIAAGTLQVGNGGATGAITGDVTDNGTLAFNRTGALTYAGAITGTGAVILSGGAGYTFAGHSNYSGDTTINGSGLTLSGGGSITGTGTTTLNGNSTLTVSGAGSELSTGTLAVGSVTGSTPTVVIDNGGAVKVSGDANFGGFPLLADAATLTVSGAGSSLQVGGTLSLGRSAQTALDATITGGATIQSNGAVIGTPFSSPGDKKVTLSGAGTSWTNTAKLSVSGTLSVLDGAQLSTGSFDVTVSSVPAALIVSGANAKFSSAGNLSLKGAGTSPSVTLANGGAMSVGGQVILGASAVLNIGGAEGQPAAAAGTLDAPTLAFGGPGTGRVNFNHTEIDYAFATAMSGAGTINQLAGVTRLTGDSSGFAGDTAVSGGTLLVDGTLGDPTSTVGVATGGALGGTGVIGGGVTVADGAINPGAPGAVGTLTVNGGLALGAGSVLNYEFGQANVPGGSLNDLLTVGGDLTLDGTLNVSQTAGGSFGPGLYRIISYGGTLTDNGLALGSLPSGAQASVQTAIANQVNLVNAGGAALSFWDGDLGPKNDGAINGGNGTWRATGDDNWTDATGAANAPYANGSFAIFAGAPGTVSVDTTNGEIRSSGMQFATDGYSVQGDAITLVPGADPQATIRVGDGTAEGAGYTATIATALTGTAGLAKTDLGTLALTGTSSYSGATDVLGGTLAVDGAIASSAVTVHQGAALAGNGTVGGLMVATGGTVAPGHSIGTLQVAGNYTQASGATYQVEVDPTSAASDQIAVTGAATLQSGAVINVTKTTNAPYVLGTRYTVLTTTNGLRGTFDVTGDTALTAFAGLTDFYDANNAYLEVGQIRPFTAAGATLNQISVATGLAGLPPTNPLMTALVNLPDDQAARAAFDQLSGEIHASVKTALIEQSHFVRDAATDRIREAFCAVGANVTAHQTIGAAAGTPAGAQDCAPNSDRLTVWGQAFGSWGHTEGDGNAASLTRSTTGFLLGADAPVAGNVRLGVLGGYSSSSFGINRRLSSAGSDDYHVGIYGGTEWGALGFRAGASYTWHDLKTSRSVAFPGFADSLTASYDAGTTQVFGDLGYRMDMGRAAFEPFANLAYVHLATDGFAETGGAAALTGRSKDTSTTFTTLGVRASTAFDLGSVTMTARGSLGWRHAFGDDTPLASLSFSGGSPFSIAGVPIAKDAAVLDVGLDFGIMENVTLGLSYGGQFATDAVDQSVRGNLSVKF